MEALNVPLVEALHQDFSFIRWELVYAFEESDSEANNCSISIYVHMHRFFTSVFEISGPAGRW